MKRVRALTEEPPLLAQYRATYPHEEQRPADQATATWEEFKAHRAAYKQVLDSLATAQQGLCFYCEQRLVDTAGKLVALDYQVEHVQAKSGAVGRVLDWTNLALACAGGTYPHDKGTYPHHEKDYRSMPGPNTSCGQTKGSADLPPGTDPRSIPLVGALIDVGMDGKMAANAANCAAAGVSDTEVTEAIGLLNLNCERLRKARQDCRDKINSWFVELLEELLVDTHLDPMQRQQMLDLVIAGRLQPSSSGHLRAFWSTERSTFGAAAENWISSNQGLF